VKLHPVPGLLKDKRVVLLDDSIVRGTTLREIVGMVRNAGASKVDVRIGCPPIVAPCYFGVDMKDRKELVANGRTQAEVAKLIGADSVHYLSLAGLVESIGLAQERLCLGCLTARYPVEVPQEHQRFQKSLAEF
jgi:amidophosphoribosyltransferase